MIYEEFPFVSSLMSTLAALPFLLFTLSADTLTQSVDVSKLAWATDVYMAAAAFTSSDWLDALLRQGRWSLGLHCDRYGLPTKFIGSRRATKLFPVRNLPTHRNVSDIAYSTRSGGTHNE